jgi:hypothetical protein
VAPVFKRLCRASLSWRSAPPIPIDYNEVLETARALANSITELAQEQFEAKSERWQNGEKGTQVRNWIEQWEMSLDDIDLELPEALAEVDPEEPAGELEDTPARPTELEHVRLQ